MSLRVYVSSHNKDSANALADRLEVAGITVCSLWHRDPSDRLPLALHREWADRTANNFAMIRSCDVHVTISDGEAHPGGKHRESGFAQGCGKRCAVVGEVENGMQHHPAVKVFADATALVAWLKGL